MTATMAWLETYNGVGAALSLVIEGVGTVFATDSMPGTYSADASPYNQWGDPSGGLIADGQVGAEIQLYAQDLKATELEFTVVDRDSVLATSLLREAYSTGLRTYVTSNVLAGSTSSITVKPQVVFPASGTIYIGDEAIAYTGTTLSGGLTASFTGITRGKFTLNQTSAGGAFSPSHIIGTNVVASATTAPSVTDYPRTWVGRFCHLLLHVRNPLTGAYNKPSEAAKIWSGRLQSYRDNGNGAISLSAKSAHDLLFRAVGGEQWTAKMNEGLIISDANSLLAIRNSQTTAYNLAQALTMPTSSTSHSTLAELINAQFEAWRSGGSTHSGDLWDLQLVDMAEGGGPRYRFRLRANTTGVPASQTVMVHLARTVWHLLGWPLDATSSTATDANGRRAVGRRLTHLTDNQWEMIAPESPFLYGKLTYGLNAKCTASSQVGTFVTQPSSDISGAPAAANGVISINGGSDSKGVYAVKYVAGSPDATIEFLAKLNVETGVFDPPQWGSDTRPGDVRLGEASEVPTIRQAWFQSGTADQLLLKCLLSTGGASGYNHATYDAITTPGFGIGVPASLVDVPSWQSMYDVQMNLLITTPKPFHDLLEPVLAASNRYLVWKPADNASNHKLSIVRPKLDSVNDLDWSLTEANKAGALGGPDRTKISRGVEGIINRVVVEYGQGLDGGTEGARTWTIEDVASQSDFGRRRTVTIKAPTITNVPTLVPAAMGPALAYFSRPLATVERSFNASLFRMAPADSVSVADNYLTDPTTGLRGSILYGWVLGTKFDLRTGRGECKIVLLPEKFPRISPWAPSAKVSVDFFNNSEYNAGTKTLSFNPHEFSATSAIKDVARFAPGDKVHVYALDETGPLEWFDTIISVGTDSVVLTNGLAGFVGAKRYVMEYDDVATVQTSQKTAPFIADDADLSTGGAISTPYDWGAGGIDVGSLGALFNTADYTQGTRAPSTTESSKGEPMSVHKLYYAALSCNSQLAYKSRVTYISNRLLVDTSASGTTETLLYLGWIPLYGHHWVNGSRSLVCRIRGANVNTAGTATFKLYSSPVKPVGSAFNSYSFLQGTTSVTFSTASTTLVWSGELTLEPSPSPAIGAARGMPGTWIAVTGVGSGAGVGAALRNIWVAEGAIS